MSTEYLIPQFIIDYLQNSRSRKSPQKLASEYLKRNKTPEIENWFKENEVNVSYIWRFFVSREKTEFYYKTCPVCGKRLNLERFLTYPDVKYCSIKCALSTKESKEKRKQTNLEKYGIENPSQSKEVLKKKEQTWLEKYGVENPFQAKVCKEKSKQTFLEKYGVKHYSQSKESKHILRSNHWETFCSKLKKKDIVPLFSKDEYITDTGRKFKCLKCGKEFESEGANNYGKEHPNKDGSYKTLLTQNISCPNCSRLFSKKEKDVLGFIKTIYDGEIQENVKGLLPNKRMELDIYFPSLNFGIEFDGDYWHSTYEVKEKDERKNKLCEQKGIRLLRIKESDWDNNPEKVKEEIQSFLNLK